MLKLYTDVHIATLLNTLLLPFQHLVVRQHLFDTLLQLQKRRFCCRRCIKIMLASLVFFANDQTL
jgi:hypothetical protein